MQLKPEMIARMHDALIHNIAEICHEANRAFCVTIGDSSQVAWDDAPEWQRASAIDGVIKALKGDPSPGESHASWLDMKIREGWSYGETKDPAKKTHPCIVHFKDLPPEQKLKDYLFLSIVNGFKQAFADGVGADKL